VGESGPDEELGRSIGAFNVAWSAGKMLGFVTGGVIIAAAGPDPALLSAAVLTAATGFLLPQRVGDPGGTRIREIGSREFVPGPVAGLDAGTRRAWRRLGWLANFVLFGIGATLNYQYPKWMIASGFTGRDFGVFLGAIYLFQTLSFVLLRRWDGWHFRIRPLLAAQGAALIAVIVLPRLHSLGWIWATAPWLGLGLGLSYNSSIYYSLFREPGRGRHTGIHEALLGSGTFLLPLLGGVSAQLASNLAAPYLLCAVVLASAMVVETGLVRRTPVVRGRT